MDTGKPLSLLWLRRDLRLHDHAAFSHALQEPGRIQPVFIFDTEILSRFPNKQDKRLSFLADTICNLHKELTKRGSGLLVLHGKAGELIPTLAETLLASSVFAGEDYEPEPIKRDRQVASKLAKSNISFNLVKDHVIFAPHEIMSGKGTPFKVYTPYAKAWRAKFDAHDASAYTIHDKDRYADFAAILKHLHGKKIKLLNASGGSEALLDKLGYTYTPYPEWPIDDARNRLKHFMHTQINAYAESRNIMADEHGTSRISPYLRFGLLSVRECMRAAMDAHSPATWIGELIWREFYMMTLFYAPNSAHEDWNPRYRGNIDWRQSRKDFTAWCEGKTGYPVVDAAMRELLETGWMHNRARMITASFLSKHILIDWRLGEEHFAQYLMDYEMASNVGGWQWAASTGTDAQPYFRVFNPTMQGKKFDPQGKYTKRYVPELKNVPTKFIHEPWRAGDIPNYPAPIVDHAQARERAIAEFKRAGAKGKNSAG